MMMMVDQDSKILKFRIERAHREPPRKKDCSLWQHGERDPVAGQYCARLDIFGCHCSPAQLRHCGAAGNIMLDEV